MRRSWTLVASALVLVGLTRPAAATPTAFSGTLSIALFTTVALGGPFVPLPPITVVAGGTADVSRSGGAITSIALAGGTFSTAVTIPVTDPAALPISQVSASLTNAAGSFSTTPGLDINNNFVADLAGQGNGSMLLQGSEKVGLFPGPLFNLSVPFTDGGPNGVGAGGGLTTAQCCGVGVSVRGAPWTIGTASVGTATAMGFVAGNTVQLVSPTYISTTIGAVATMRSFAVLTLSFVPEPGTLLLVASGVAGLGVLGRRRWRT